MTRSRSRAIVGDDFERAWAFSLNEQTNEQAKTREPQQWVNARVVKYKTIVLVAQFYTTQLVDSARSLFRSVLIFNLFVVV